MKILKSIDQIKNKNCTIFGAGIIGKRFCDLLIENKVNVLHFLDSFKTSKYKELDVLKPNDSILSKSETIIVASTKWDEIIKEFNNKHDYYVLSNNLIFQSTNLKFISDWSIDSELVNNFSELEDCFSGIEKFKFNLINNLYLKNDDLSFFKFSALEYGKNTLKYYNNKINPTIIDGGGCILNERYDSSVINQPFLYVFEPLLNYLSIDYGNHSKDDRLKIIDTALSSKEGLSYFNFDPNLRNQSFKQTKGNIAVKSNSIDNLIEIHNIDKVDIIALDIEGSELDVLIGAEKTIKKNKPYLSISIYHKPSDLYKIPLLIRTYCKDYKFKITFESPTFIGIILHAIPK